MWSSVESEVIMVQRKSMAVLIPKKKKPMAVKAIRNEDRSLGHLFWPTLIDKVDLLKVLNN